MGRVDLPTLVGLMDWYLYDRDIRHERVSNETVYYERFHWDFEKILFRTPIDNNFYYTLTDFEKV